MWKYISLVIAVLFILALNSCNNREKIIDQRLLPNNDFRLFQETPAWDLAKAVEEVIDQRILQLTPFFNKDYERELMSRLPGCTSGRWHPAFTDITAKGADKGEGLLAMAAHQGLNPQQTMAFGDGGNDSSMVRGAGIGVAMGNAIDELKEIADYVTTSVDDDGIRNALRHFGLI